mgnify:CR=1 FL=1
MLLALGVLVGWFAHSIRGSSAVVAAYIRFDGEDGQTGRPQKVAESPCAQPQARLAGRSGIRGSAHTPEDVEVLKAVARQRLHAEPGQPRLR